MRIDINKKIAPESEEINNINFIQAQLYVLKTGLNIHYISAGTEDVIRLDLVFDGGINKQEQNAVAVATNTMLAEGTSKYSAKQIAEQLDYYGAYFQTHCTADDSVVTLYCLKKHFSSCVPYIIEIISDSVFPEKELETYKTNAIQRLAVNEQRNSFLNRRIFYSSIFGKQCCYGTYSSSVDYEKISRETLVSFFNHNYKMGIKYILMAGCVDETILKVCEQLFSGIPVSILTKKPITEFDYPLPKSYFIEKKDSVQSAIRIGRALFNRTHPDNSSLQLLNLILGGYFGSRLMRNIREEKGLTYGIHSSVESYLRSGCFYISTEINAPLQEKGLTEIYREISNLRKTVIPHDELMLAKNYMMGSFLRSVDGPFSIMDRHKILIDYKLSYQYYYNFIEKVKNTTPNNLIEIANKYLQEQDLIEVIVGKKNAK